MRASVLFCMAAALWLGNTGHAGEGEAPAPLSAAQLDALANRYAAGDEAARAAVLKELAGRDALQPSATAGWLAKILAALRKQGPILKPVPTDMLANLEGQHRTGAQMGGGGGTRQVATVESAVGPVRVVLMDPPRPNAPVLIYLHGGGHVGGHDGSKDNEMAWNWGIGRASKIASVGMRLLVRCVDDKAVNAWVIPSGPQAVNAVLDALQRSFQIDPDKVYLMGNSMGGYGAWYFAAIEADRYAACASLAGGSSIKGATFENYRALPFGVFIGEKDGSRYGSAKQAWDDHEALKKSDPGAYPGLFKGYPGMGHNIEDSVYADVDGFFKGKARAAYPRLVLWRPLVTWKKRFYNLGLEDPKPGMSVRAEMKEDNRIVVTGAQGATLTVYLNEKLVDFKKPVVVTWNGQEAFNGTLTPTLSTMLETLGDRSDAGMYYTAKVVLKP